MNRKNFLRSGFSLVFITLVIWVISCAVNPVTKKREFMLITETEEISMGKEADAQVLQTYGKYENAQLDGYVNTLGKKMVKLSHRPNLDFSFRVLDSPVINAFAVPGGFVYLTRGILGYLNNEAELAGVMGHEIGHVTARHSAKQYSESMVAQLGLQLGATFSETFSKYAGIANFGVGMLFLRFSRDNERQADQLGVEYSTKAGYDASNMAKFFETLERLNPGQDMSGLPGWFSTHPNSPDRIKAVQGDATKWQKKFPGTKFASNRDEYLRKIDGIIYGDDPRQGYVENGIFYHPTLKLQFAIPAQWQLNNTPAQVQMVNQAQDAVIIFTMAAETSPTAAVDKYISNSGANVLSSEAIKVNGMSAQRVDSKITSEGTVIHALSYFIQRDGKVYVFHGYTTDDKFNTYSATFRQTMDQFKNLTDQHKINVQPAILKIKKTTTQSTLQEALKSFGVSSGKMSEIAILNGMELSDAVSANTLIKVVEK